jgi:hypothetical protein
VLERGWYNCNAFFWSDLCFLHFLILIMLDEGLPVLTVITLLHYRVVLVSPHRAGNLYSIDSVRPLGHPLTAAALRTVIQETRRMSILN